MNSKKIKTAKDEKDELSDTPAIRVLREKKIDFEPHVFEYVEKAERGIRPLFWALMNTRLLKL